MPKSESVASTPADPVAQFAELKIDGETYHLAYDFNAIAEAEKLAGAKLLLGIAGLMNTACTAAQLRGLLYAGLRKAQPKMTIAEVGQLIRIDTLPAVYEAIRVAYEASMPESKQDPREGGSPPPASN